MARLTALKVKHAKAGRHGDGGGLYLLVSKTGGKSWMLRTIVETHEGPKRRDIGLGPESLCSLEEARDKARELRKVARAGGDPIAARDKAKIASPTFEEAARKCHAALKAGWEERHAKAFLSTLALHAFPRIGGLRVESVDEADIVSVLSPIWTTKPAAARKLRQRIGLVLDYAKGQKWRKVPAPRESLSVLLSKQAASGNFASMPYEESPPFMESVEALPDTWGRLALLFTIYTAARNGEVREAQWSHLHTASNEWRRPAELMRKNGKAHAVTLNPQALAVLERARQRSTNGCDGLIFEGMRGGQLSDMTLGKIVRPTGYTVHGFRSTFRTWAAEKMPSIPEAVAEAALAHVIPDKVERSYNRAKFLDMRRKLLDAWGRYVSGASADVVQLPLRLGGKASA
ncbi:site-specific integrase [Pontixanthobacter sp. CEM42]|uniref:tyrosine-type recombinase/integrase n=1 Tax=Pontixanthobacter sp. CEM42 TaxID=2792077 RepID=UPI001ADECB22|nr:site-specific integrase [Pontixanthobacter sp. CEM42]